ncbi:MAG: recombinase family protein [Candidatus Gastranaerophilales bacterium]
MGKVFAYVRVSSKEQKEDRQLDALRGFTVDEVVVEKASGKDFSRPMYQTLKSQLRSGDLLILHSIDRLGRNYAQICEEWQTLVRRGVDIQVLDMPVLNTRDNQNGLTGQLITNIILQLLGYVSERERVSIKTRQAEGIVSAKSRGVKFGRPKVKVSKEFVRAYELYNQGIIKMVDVLCMCKIGRSTFFRWANSLNNVA